MQFQFDRTLEDLPDSAPLMEYASERTKQVLELNILISILVIRFNTLPVIAVSTEFWECISRKQDAQFVVDPLLDVEGVAWKLVSV